MANRRASIHWDEESLNDDAHWRFFLFFSPFFPFFLLLGASIHWDEESLNDDAHGRFFLFLPLVFLSSFVRGSR